MILVLRATLSDVPRPNTSSSKGVSRPSPEAFGHLWMGKLWWEFIAGWWFETCFIFPYIGNSNPNWLSYFFRGVGLNHQLDRNHRSERWFTVIIQGIHPLIMKKHGLHLEKSGFDSQTRRSPSYKQALPWWFEFINIYVVVSMIFNFPSQK